MDRGMSGIVQNHVAAKEESFCWVFRYPTPAIPHQFENDIEKIFPGYKFYPEVEWPKYGCVPPESLPVLGAWRHPQNEAFAFLLEIASAKKGLKSKQARLYMFGSQRELQRCDSEISHVKASIEQVEKRALRNAENEQRFKEGDHSRFVRQLLALSTLFTMLVNALSYYLRKLEPPDLPPGFMHNSYLALVVSVHFLALVQLVLISLVSAIYVIKYAIALIRRV
jgi:hypothetical protein